MRDRRPSHQRGCLARTKAQMGCLARFSMSGCSVISCALRPDMPARHRQLGRGRASARHADWRALFRDICSFHFTASQGRPRPTARGLPLRGRPEDVCNRCGATRAEQGKVGHGGSPQAARKMDGEERYVDNSPRAWPRSERRVRRPASHRSLGTKWEWHAKEAASA